MKLLSKAEELLASMQEIKDQGGLLVTNFFIDSEKLAYWIEKKLVFFDYTEEGILIFRKNYSFYHLYFYTNALERLHSLVKSKLPKKQLVIDLIGKEETLAGLLQLFTASGFLHHTRLDRYIRINKEDSAYYQGSFNEITLAENRDAENLTRLFHQNFDRLSEQVPDADEVEQLIRDKKILLIKDSEVIKGFLVRTFNGQTTLLNNFLVDKPYRGEKLGSKLLKHYIFESRTIKRMILWVISDNEPAVGAYLKHGYKKEGLVDYVLINNYDG